MWRIIRLLPGAALLCFSLGLRAADPLDNWTIRNPLPTPNNFRAVASGNGLVVAVGTVGTIVTSADSGETWTARDSGLTNLFANLSCVAYGNGKFVAVPESGFFDSVVISTNGTNWTLSPAGFNASWNFTALTFGGGTFVLVGYGGVNNLIFTSTNGTSWTQRTSGVSDGLYAITYAQNQFVAVGGTGFPTNRGFIVTSPDGITWTARRTNAPVFYASVAGNATGFVAVGNATTSRSANGVSWTDLIDAGVAGRNAVAASSNLFVSADTVGGNNDYSVFYSSVDGAAWANRGTASSLTAITWANGRFIAVGAWNDPGVSALGTRAAIYVSDDGIAWRIWNQGFRRLADSNYGLAYGNGSFVAILTNSIAQGAAFVSTNGVEWSGNSFPASISQTPAGLTFAAGQFVAVGGYDFSGGTVITTSTNGVNWTERYTGTRGPLTAAAYGGGQFVAVGRRAAGERPVLTSPTGTSWTVQTAGISNDLFGVTYGGGAFVAVGAAGTVARSTDGSIWSQQSITPSNHLRSVTFAAAQFVAVGDAGSIFTSPDGSAWTRRSSGTTRDLNVVTYFSNRFLAGGDFGTLLVSTNAITWSSADAGTDLSITGAAASPNALLLAGLGGVLGTSPNGLDWTPRSMFTFPAGYDTLMRKVLAVEDRVLAFVGGAQIRSATGRSWATQPVGTFTGGNNALYTNGLLIAVGTEETAQVTRISVSTNRGDSFTDMNLGTLGQLYGLAYGNGLYVTCGDRPSGTNAPVLTSTNGFNWTFRNSGMPAALWDLAYGNGLFVAVGSSGGVKSTDGITWTTNSGAKGETVAFGGGKFVAAGTSILLSTNGTNWSTVVASGVNIENVRYGFGTFVAVGPSGIYTSTDGSNWTSRFVRTRQKLNAVEFANDSFFVVGYAGTIYQSDFLTNTPATIVQGPANQTVLAGNNVTFQASVTGRLPLTYQWFKNNVPISGATDPILTLIAITNADAGNYHVVVRNDTSSATSAPATLTVVDPAVAVLPGTLYLFTGTTGSFTSSVTGAAPLNYQWRKGVANIGGATNSMLVFSNAQVGSNGSYSVVVNFTGGSRTSTNSGQLIVMSSLGEVDLQTIPSSQQVPNGSTVSIAADVRGPTPLTYQWRKNGTNISGATGATLVLTNVLLTAAGDYTYYVTYSLGAVTNEFYPSTLNVYYAEPPVITSSGIVSPGLMQITFTGLIGREYQVDYAGSLTPPIDWQLYGYYQLTANPKTIPVGIPVLGTYPNAYFRIKILPP